MLTSHSVSMQSRILGLSLQMKLPNIEVRQWNKTRKPKSTKQMSAAVSSANQETRHERVSTWSVWRIKNENKERKQTRSLKNSARRRQRADYSTPSTRRLSRSPLACKHRSALGATCRIYRAHILTSASTCRFTLN